MLLLVGCAPQQRSASPSGTPPPGSSGSISGRLSFPSEGIPPLQIYAIRAEAGDFVRVLTVTNQTTYTIKGVPPGVYHVIAYRSPELAGAYSQVVACGTRSGCTDHTLIRVTVRAGESVRGIDPADWYAPPGTFRPPPGPQPTPGAANRGSVFPGPKEAAIAQGEAFSGGIYIGSDFGRCPINQACLALGEPIQGDRAASVVGQAGSNDDSEPCAVYLGLLDSAGGGIAPGWRFVDMVCRTAPAAPAVGRDLPVTFIGTGCVNVRDGPSLRARILTCLANGTLVTIDGGPTYAEEIPAGAQAREGHVWWHLKDKGWMAHDFLRGYP